MSSSIKRHRAAKAQRYADHARAVLNDVSIYGDAATTKQVGEGLATGASALTEIISKAQQSAADKKAAEERAKHVEPAKKARAAATAKANEAKYAMMEADATEKEPYGPKHQKAQALLTEAADLDAKAREEEAAAGMTPLTSLTVAPHGGPSKPFEFPSWAKWVALGLGGVVVVGVGYRLLAGRK